MHVFLGRREAAIGFGKYRFTRYIKRILQLWHKRYAKCFAELTMRFESNTLITYANKFPYIILLTAINQYFRYRVCKDAREIISGVYFCFVIVYNHDVTNIKYNNSRIFMTS